MRKQRLPEDRRLAEQIRQRLRSVACLGSMMLVAVAGVALPPHQEGEPEALAASLGPAVGAERSRSRQASEQTGASVSIAAVGDIVMGTRRYGLPPDGGASLFADVDDELTGDVVLGNLEATLSSGGSSKCGAGSSDCFAFQTPPSYARWLKRAGFTIVNLANNHAFDFGEKGRRQTIAALEGVGLPYTGLPGHVAFQQVGKSRVAILGFSTYPWAESMLDLEAARELVRRADEEADVVVVTMHAGAEGRDHAHVRPGPETYLDEPRGNVVAFAHAVVEAGADLVVGHGPHVLRGMEWYENRLIAYSMGNFAGYKVFALGGTLSVSGILKVTLQGDGAWVKGRLVATELTGLGLPAIDQAARARGLVRKLSKEDFGRRGMRVSQAGDLTPPARGVS